MVSLPKYETLLIEALQSLAIDSGTVTSAAAVGGNALMDTAKNWQTNVHRYRLVKIIKGQGVGQAAYIRSNTDNTLVITGGWRLPVGVGATYVILSADIAQVIKDTLGGGFAVSFKPIEKALVHNAAVVAATDILPAVLAPTNTPCRFLVEVAFDAAGAFSVGLTNGGVTAREIFNHGVNLTINDLFRFSHLVHAGDTINYQYSVNATMLSMRVQEIVAAA